MNILLVAINAKYIHSNPAVFSLKSCTGRYESYVDVVEFTINQHPSYIMREIFRKKPDVIAFSCYIWNCNIIDSIICDLHKILPDTDIWAGGPEVSYNASEIIQRWKLRGVMTGPGEGVFAHLVSSYVEGHSDHLPIILDGNVIHRLTLDEIPFWYEDLSDFEHRIIYYESSRGCPFSCSYCLSSIDKNMDFRSVNRVCLELGYFLNQKVPQVKFVDRTFNCRKDHALPILQYILENDNKVTNFHFEIAADLLDDDYFDLFKQFRPGAVQLEIGVQSTCPETICEIERVTDFEKISSAVKRISSFQNIHVHLDLIAGLPFEDLLTFQTSFNDVYSLYPEQLQLGFLKVLKGSNMELRSTIYELQYTCLPPYEVLSTKWLSYEDICHLKQIEEVLEIYYNSGQFRNTLNYLNSFFDTPYSMYEYLASWYEEHDLFGIQSSRVRKYEILLEFGMWHITSYLKSYEDVQQVEMNSCLQAEVLFGNNSVELNSKILGEYITYDLYLRENMKNRPSFIPSLEKRKNDIHDILYSESETHRLFPKLADCNYRELTKILHVEIFEAIFDQPVAVVFYYEMRNPLTNNCVAIRMPLNND